jgi:hypothetical protein
MKEIETGRKQNGERNRGERETDKRMKDRERERERERECKLNKLRRYVNTNSERK